MSTANPQNEISHASEHPSVWLDHLPLEVCARIASMLPPIEYEQDRRAGYYKSTPPAITLATVSTFQKRAVALAQNRHLHVQHANNIQHTLHLVTSWHRILNDDIRQIFLPLNIDYDPHHEITHILSLPTIQKATIPNCPPLLDALTTGASVRKLEISLMCYCFEDRENVIGLSRVLRACRVEELLLTCDTCIRFLGTKCLAITTLETLSKGPSWCSIRSLKVACYTKELVQALEIALPVFPNLENLCLEHRIDLHKYRINTDEVLIPFTCTFSPAFEERLRSLKFVGIMNCGALDRFIPMLEARLVVINSRIPVSSDVLRNLELCPNLEFLDIVLERDAEESFPNSLCSLRSISLTWSKQRDLSTDDNLSSPKSEFFIGLVRRNKLLEELSLQNVKILPTVLEDMLRTLGDRLQSLKLLTFGKAESPKDRTLRVIRLIMMYNRNLSELSFGEAQRPRPYHTTRCPHHVDENDPNADEIIECSACAQMKFINMVWLLVERNLPRLSNESVVQVLGALGMYEIAPACPIQ